MRDAIQAVNDTPTERAAHDSATRYLRQCATADGPGQNDLFHDSVPDGFIGSVWDVMAKTPRHTYQILTKRPGRMRSLLRKWERDGWTWRRDDSLWCGPVPGPLPNVWLGVSAEDRKWWDIRWPVLAETPAALRFVSAEPLLGPIDMGLAPGKPAPDWLIIGGESGSGARPMALDWVRDMLAQCRQPGVPTVPFIKQLGAVGGREAGAGPKGGDWDAWPEDLRVRQFPRAAGATG